MNLSLAVRKAAKTTAGSVPGSSPTAFASSGRSARDYALLDGPTSTMVTEIEKYQRPKSQRAGASTYGPSL